MAAIDQIPEQWQDGRIVVDENGCWIWQMQINKAGYGVACLNGEQGLAHRMMWRWFHGEIPEETVDHLCMVRACVNPEHLEPVPRIVNTQRANALREPSTHCRHGHEYTEENTRIISTTGARQCVACDRESSRVFMKAHYARNRDKILARRRQRYARQREMETSQPEA